MDTAEDANAEFVSEDGEVEPEELVRPSNFRENHEDGGGDDEQPINDGPERASGFCEAWRTRGVGVLSEGSDDSRFGTVELSK